LELGCRAPDQGKIGAVVQATNVFAAVSFSVDFQKGAEELFWRKLFDCEANGVRCPGKSSVANWSTPISAAPRGEQLCLDSVIEHNHDSRIHV
jgi:hypothetical protein